MIAPTRESFRFRERCIPTWLRSTINIPSEIWKFDQTGRSRSWRRSWGKCSRAGILRVEIVRGDKSARSRKQHPSRSPGKMRGRFVIGLTIPPPVERGGLGREGFARWPHASPAIIDGVYRFDSLLSFDASFPLFRIEQLFYRNTLRINLVAKQTFDWREHRSCNSRTMPMSYAQDRLAIAPCNNGFHRHCVPSHSLL